MPIQFLSNIGYGGTEVPYERRSAISFMTGLALNPQDALRMRRYEEHWRFFTGVHWSFRREDGEPLITANYCRAVINKKASFLVGKGLTLRVPEPFEDITRPVLEEVWRYNKKQRLLLEMAITGGTTGDCFMLVTYERPSSAKLMLNPYTQGRIRLRLLGSQQVFPRWNPLNREELLFVRIITEVKDNIPPSSAVAPPGRDSLSLGASTARPRRYIEDIYPDRIVEGWDGEDNPTTRPNDLGEIPLVHIVNEPCPGEYYGMSDLDGIIDIQREFNEKMTDISDIINYHSAPITIITGARAKQLEKGPKALWTGLPTDAKVFNLELGGDLGASHKYLEFVRQVMFDLSGLPEGSLGRIQPISNTSAAALQVQFQPLIETTERKAPGYEHGLEEINYFILRYWQLVNNRMFPIDICASCGGRIVSQRGMNKRGRFVEVKRCYLIDKQTLEFLKPEEVPLMWKRRFSYGIEARRMPYGQVKKEFLKEGASYWDPQGEVDLEEKAKETQERQRKLEQFNLDQEQAENTPSPVWDEASQGWITPEAPKRELPPEEARPPAEVKPEKLPPHDMDIPEEPEEVDVNVYVWDPNQRQFVEERLGKMRLVPTGCNRPVYLSPYDTEMILKSALPRDKEKEANLYAVYQSNQWMSRRWCQTHLDEDLQPSVEDKQIADDIPFILAAQGKPEGAQVQGSQGVQGDLGVGTNYNNAPNPPFAGPGRGNKFAPGDQLATKVIGRSMIGGTPST